MKVLFVISVTVLIGYLCASDTCNEGIFDSIPADSQDAINNIIGLSTLIQLENSPISIPSISQDNVFWLVHTGESIVLNLRNSLGSSFIITAIAINQIPPKTELLEGQCVTNIIPGDTQEFLIRNTIDGSSSDLASGYSNDGIYVFDGIATDFDVSIKRAVNPILSDEIEVSLF